MDDPTQREKLSDAEKREYDMRRVDFFKGTIAVTVIYATVIILICAVGIFSDSGYTFLFEEGYVFIVTLVIGVILIVSLLLYQIYTYKAVKKTVVSGDTYTCPDYWELKKTPEDILKVFEERAGKLTGADDAGNIKGFSNYYCQDTRHRQKGSMTVTTSTPSTKANDDLKFITEKVYAKGMDENELDDDYTMNCSLLYPAYMEMKDTYKVDNKISKIDNKVRCEYIKQCASSPNNKNIVWSGICPTA